MKWLIDYKETGSEEILLGEVHTSSSNKEKAIEAIEKSGKYEVIRLEKTTTHHRCPYCGEIAEGTYEQLLCKECRETFGHSTFDEL